MLDKRLAQGTGIKFLLEMARKKRSSNNTPQPPQIPIATEVHLQEDMTTQIRRKIDAIWSDIDRLDDQKNIISRTLKRLEKSDPKEQSLALRRQLNEIKQEIEELNFREFQLNLKNTIAKDSSPNKRISEQRANISAMLNATPAPTPEEKSLLAKKMIFLKKGITAIQAV